MSTRRTHNSKRLAILSLIVLGASTLGGCTGTYLYSDHGWSNSYGGGYGHHDNHSSISYGSVYYSGSHYSGSRYRGSRYGGGSHRGGSRSHSSGHSGRH